MRKLPLIIIYLLILSLSGCLVAIGRSTSPIPESSRELVNEIINSNSFIDVDAAELTKSLTNPDSRSSADIKKVSEMKAATYRFFKHVKVEDGYYVCDLDSGKTINISEHLFSALNENLAQMNAAIKEAKEQGIEIVTAVPDSSYLNSLLK